MTKKIWTENEDTTLYGLRSQGVGWDDISKTFRVPVSTCMDRARAIGAGRGFVRKHQVPAPVVWATEPDDYDRPPLPPGHPYTWGLLTTGTSLEGADYIYQL